MNRLYKYIIQIFVLLLVIRFSGRIFYYLVRFWYVSLPIGIYLLYYYRKKKKQMEFNKRTDLDPEKEVKLKKEPEIKDENDISENN